MSCIVVKHRKKAAAPFLFESLSYFLTNIHDRWHDNWSIFLVYSLGLGWGAPSGSCNSWLSTVLASQVDCSQPSIFSYFNSMVESADRITWKLVASAKPKTWLGRGWRAGFFFLSSLASPTPPPYPPPPHPILACFAFSFACVAVNSLQAKTVFVKQFKFSEYLWRCKYGRYYRMILITRPRPTRLRSITLSLWNFQRRRVTMSPWLPCLGRFRTADAFQQKR